MGFTDSYLGQLRRKVGHDLVLCPGAQVVVQLDDGRVLLQRRSDNRVWEIPAGSCEPGQSFATTAITELREETGIHANVEALIPFACLSEPDLHTLTYPNGDQVHAFALCFLLRVDHIPNVTALDGEATEHQWCDPTALPSPMHPPTTAVLTYLEAYQRTGQFQAH